MKAIPLSDIPDNQATKLYNRVEEAVLNLRKNQALSLPLAELEEAGVKLPTFRANLPRRLYPVRIAILKRGDALILKVKEKP